LRPAGAELILLTRVSVIRDSRDFEADLLSFDGLSLFEEREDLRAEVKGRRLGLYPTVLGDLIRGNFSDRDDRLELFLAGDFVLVDERLRPFSVRDERLVLFSTTAVREDFLTGLSADGPYMAVKSDSSSDFDLRALVREERLGLERFTVRDLDRLRLELLAGDFVLRLLVREEHLGPERFSVGDLDLFLEALISAIVVFFMCYV